MTTLTFHVKDSLLEEVLTLLGQFDRSEVAVVGEYADFLEIKKNLHEQMELYRKGEMKTYTIEEVDTYLEEVIKEYENQ